MRNPHAHFELKGLGFVLAQVNRHDQKKEIAIAKKINKNRHLYSPRLLKELRVDYYLSLEK
jgi:hypothetical protein